MCIKDGEIYFFLLKMKKLQMEKKIQLFLIFIFIDSFRIAELLTIYEVRFIFFCFIYDGFNYLKLKQIY